MVITSRVPMTIYGIRSIPVLDQIRGSAQRHPSGAFVILLTTLAHSVEDRVANSGFELRATCGGARLIRQVHAPNEHATGPGLRSAMASVLGFKDRNNRSEERGELQTAALG